MSGAARGAGAISFRAVLRCAEGPYTAIVTARNRLYNAGIIRTTSVPRPVISIGNITTGGTGKTPLVRWLADRLRDEGRRVAILSRGYRSAGSLPGDELTMLDGSLNDARKTPVILRANPDRAEAAAAVFREDPRVDVFLLDDAFQHRRVARDLDIVLINAAEPFGFDHVLPRGLLREPLSGLGRAGAIVLTHSQSGGPEALAAIEEQIRRHNRLAPIYRASHALVGLRALSTPAAAPADYTMEELDRRRFFAFCGIGYPQSLHRQLSNFAGSYVGHHWFGDHHEYTLRDLRAVENAARSAGAEIMLTTEKDWAKVASLDPSVSLPIWRVEMRIEFANGDEQRLLAQIHSVLT
jgi:tetraacyldisaccharide 4'-kinase